MAASNVVPVIPAEEGKAGQLLRVKLINFMSHAHFEVYFRRYVNLIHGENGSGKSAVLQAVQLCLGARASQTGRGKSKKLKDFIKHGSNQATVYLSIWNTGGAAHLSDRYGKVITIERKINQAASSHYGLYSAQGKKISSSRGDVDDMMNQLNICGNNPIVVLTQDGAREFLKDGHLDRSMYNLYMHATQFRETLENMQASDTSVKIQHDGLVRKEEEISNKIKKLEDLEARIKILGDAQDISARLKNLRHCFPYVQVQVWKDLVEGVKKNLNEVVLPKIEELRTLLIEKGDAVKTAEENQKEADAKMSDLKCKINESKKLVGDLNHEKGIVQQRKNGCARMMRGLKAKLEELEQEKEEYKREIESTQGNFENSVQSARRQYAECVASKEEELNRLKAAVFRGKQEVTEFEAARDYTQEEHEQKTKELKKMEAKVNEMRSHIQKHRLGMRDPYTHFGGKMMHNFCNYLEQQKDHFHQKPLGPLGLFLSLENDYWGLAVEFAIQKKLTCFVVTDFHDKRVLMAAAAHMKIRIDVVIYDFRTSSYNIGSGRAGIPTVLEVLRFKEDCENVHILRNVLIDTCQVEITGLLQDEDTANNLVRSNKIQTVILPNGRRVFKKGGSVNSIHDGRSLRPSLAKDVTQVIQMLEQQLSAMEVEVQNAQAAWRSVRFKLEAEKNNVQRAIEDAQQSEQDQNQIESEIDQLKEAGPRLEVDGLTQIQDMQEAADKVDEECIRTREKIAELSVELESASTNLSEVLEKMQLALNSRSEVNRLAQDVRVEIDEHNRQWSIAKHELTEIEEELEAAKRKQNTEEEHIVKYDEYIENAWADAQENCTEAEFQVSMQWLFEDIKREFPDESEDDIRKMLSSPDWLKKKEQAVQRTLEKSQRLAHGNLEELEECKLAQDADLHKSKSMHWDFKIQHDMLKKMYRKRAMMFNQIRQATDGEVDKTFTLNMRRRGHTGNVSIDHDVERLYLKVRMQGQDKYVGDMRSLSGGEKSFTTVAFVLSLASIIISPFYCLDEFDVFMDAVNRRLVIEALLHEAYENRDASQFIFFTPLPTGALEEARAAVSAKLGKSGETFPEGFINVLQLQPPRQS